MMEFDPLLLSKQEIAGKKMVVGYDGFIDTLVRPVERKASEQEPEEYFQTIEAFGKFLVDKAGKSCSIELKVESKCPGGNMPSLASGAKALGMDVTCIGLLGEGGEISEEFEHLSPKAYSFAPPGVSTCMEFQDGKIFLAPQTPSYEQPFALVEEATGGKAVDFLREADILALVNYSELPFSYELWKETYHQAFGDISADKNKFAFFDLCDVSAKAKEEVEAVIQLIGCYSSKRKTILSLNENEANVIEELLFGKGEDICKTGELLREKYGIDEILIHTLKMSVLITENGMFQQASIFVEHPVRSTGAGDHFNGASCVAVVMGLEEEQRIAFANQYVNQYLRTGKTPTGISF